MANDRSVAMLTIAFAAIGVGFFASTLYTELESSGVDAEVALIEANSVPSVEHLAAARGELRHLEVATDRLAEAKPGGHEEAKRMVAEARARLDAEVQGELATPDYPGEKEASDAARKEIDALEASIARWVEAAPVPGSAAPFDAHAGIDRVDVALTRWMNVNSIGGRAGLERIKALRSSSVRLALSLDVLCAILAIVAAVIALRALRRQHATEAAHERVLNERASELEMFAKRVAHDLLSPLSSLSFILSSLRRSVARGEPTEELLFRADACLTRSRRLVDGALDFARSAATLAAGRSHLREVIDGVVEETHAEETDGVEVVVEPFSEVDVACSAGVLTSILSNLVQNAVKYTEERAVRKITLRVAPLSPPAPGRVRVEVQDTGPGLPPGFERAVFEPYVRAPDAKPGLGLGLATVRRFVEAHGGRVGVDSVPDQGCVFWFELPRSPEATPAP